MKFWELKQLNYPEAMELEQVLAHLIYKNRLSVVAVLAASFESMQKELHKQTSRYNEACISIQQMLGFKGNDKESSIKRAIHSLNLNPTLVPGIFDEEYHYTEEDKKYWDEFCELHYGKNFNEEE